MYAICFLFSHCCNNNNPIQGSAPPNIIISISVSLIAFLGFGGASLRVPPKNGAAVIAAVDPKTIGEAMVGLGFNASKAVALSDEESMLIGSPVGVLLGGNDIDGVLDDEKEGDGGDGAAFGGGGGGGGCCVGCGEGEEEEEADDVPACPSATMAISCPTVILSPSLTSIASILPALGALTSTVTLSVSI